MTKLGSIVDELIGGMTPEQQKLIEKSREGYYPVKIQLNQVIARMDEEENVGEEFEFLGKVLQTINIAIQTQDSLPSEYRSVMVDYSLRYGEKAAKVYGDREISRVKTETARYLIMEKAAHPDNLLIEGKASQMVRESKSSPWKVISLSDVEIYVEPADINKVVDKFVELETPDKLIEEFGGVEKPEEDNFADSLTDLLNDDSLKHLLAKKGGRPN